MNIPNKLTILRIVLVPVFVAVILSDCFGDNTRWVALAVFIVASLTDLLDGKIARKYGLVTNFGKFMDPLADKMLVCSALICLVELNRIPSWMVIIIVVRDFVISGFRLVAAENGRVIAANMWGKFKTTSQMVMICLLIADIRYGFFPLLSEAFKWIALILTVISLVVYLVDNKDVMKEE